MNYLMVLVDGQDKPKRVTVDKVQARGFIRMILDKENKHQSSKFLAKKMVREMDTGGVVSLRNPASGGTLLAGRTDKEDMLNSLLEDIQATMHSVVH